MPDSDCDGADLRALRRRERPRTSDGTRLSVLDRVGVMGACGVKVKTLKEVTVCRRESTHSKHLTTTQPSTNVHSHAPAPESTP